MSKITKKKAEYIFKKIEQWTRAEIVARHGELPSLKFADAAQTKIDIENKIRKVLFGTSDLVQLGIKWKIVLTTDDKTDSKIKKALKNENKKIRTK
jgi:hypothetical protein